jgi:predicted DNA-binding transcriptional regulator AlpA
MDSFSTRQVAKMLGLGAKTLSHYIAIGKVPTPKIVRLGGLRIHAWSQQDIERLRKLLPKIKNGRKTRHKKEEKSEKRPKRKKKS